MATKQNKKRIPFWDVDRDLKPYWREPELKRQAEGQITGIIKFMNENGLFKKKRKTFDPKGKLAIRRVFGSDLTAEGVAFVRAVHKQWFRSKATAKDPTNTKLLEKYLKQLRK